MLPQEELLLMAGIVGIYAIDSSLLLYANEAIVSPMRGAGWSVGFGSGQFRVAGRDVFVPDLIAPHRPLFRLQWNIPCAPGQANGGWGGRRALFSPLAPFIWGMVFALFVFLPLGLFTRLGEPALLAALVLLYVCIFAVLFRIGMNRHRFGLSGRRFAALAFEALVCSPLALNLARKISREMQIGEDLVCAARELQTPKQWKASRTTILARVDEELEMEDEASQRRVELQRYRDALMAGGA